MLLMCFVEISFVARNFKAACLVRKLERDLGWVHTESGLGLRYGLDLDQEILLHECVQDKHEWCACED